MTNKYLQQQLAELVQKNAIIRDLEDKGCTNIKVSIDMSTDESTAQNRIYGEVIESQITSGEETLLCDFAGANYDFTRHKEITKLKNLLHEWIKFYPIILYEHEDTLKTKDIIELFDKTREVLK